jgi:adenylosuccinate synthase
LICTAYKQGNKIFKSSPTADAAFLEEVKPKLTNLPSWKNDISEIRKFEDLPYSAKKYLLFIQKHLGLKITFVGVGQHKDAKIIL